MAGDERATSTSGGDAAAARARELSSSPLPQAAAGLRRLWDSLHPLMDVILGRLDGGQPPPWDQARGWSEGLLALDAQQVARAEQLGLSRVAPDLAGLHPDLRQLCRWVEAEIGPFRGSDEPLAPVATQRVRLRKRTQVAALAQLCRQHWPAVPERIVDLGSGHGHLCGALAEQLGVPVLGLEHRPELVATARQLQSKARFAVLDASECAGLRAGDLAAGLHACGALGDSLVLQARQAGADVLLVSCCQQKRDEGTRRPLSRLGGELGLCLTRQALGLSNLSYGAQIVPKARALQGRAVRLGLRRLLQARGLEVQPGDECEGIHRRHFQRGLGAVGQAATSARGLPPPTAAESEHFEALGEREFGRARRLDLARNMLGRPLELALVFDRAVALEEAGYQVQVVPAFSEAASPRNLAILAHR